MSTRSMSKQTRSKVSATPRIDTFYGKEPGLAMMGEESGDIIKIPWEEVIHKHVRTSDNVDIGMSTKSEMNLSW